jgi:hypothetical protein
MSLIIEGGVTPFILLLVLIAAIYYFMRSAKGKEMYIRRIPGLDALDECVGRATEMGKPVHFIPGIAGINTSTAPQTMAALNILGYVASLTAKSGADLSISIRQPMVMPLVNDTVREAYVAAGISDQFPGDAIQFLGWTQFAFTGAVLGRLRRELPGANLMFGGLYAETLMIAETGAEVGAMQVMGTAAVYQIPFLLAACDYALIADEIYAADAYLSKDPVSLGSIRGVDIGKLFGLLAIVIGSILASLNIDWLSVILSK